MTRVAAVAATARGEQRERAAADVPFHDGGARHASRAPQHRGGDGLRDRAAGAALTPVAGTGATQRTASSPTRPA